MIGRLALIAGLLLFGQMSTAEAQRKERVAILRGLDKVTARISAIEAQIDRPVRFGSLEITVRDCRTRPPEEPPETTAFLEVVELKPDEEPATVFSGWMFASSPALSAMEHPVYDVWVIDCTIASPRLPSGNE